MVMAGTGSATSLGKRTSTGARRSPTRPADQALLEHSGKYLGEKVSGKSARPRDLDFALKHDPDSKKEFADRYIDSKWDHIRNRAKDLGAMRDDARVKTKASKAKANGWYLSGAAFQLASGAVPLAAKSVADVDPTNLAVRSVAVALGLTGAVGLVMRNVIQQQILLSVRNEKVEQFAQAPAIEELVSRVESIVMEVPGVNQSQIRWHASLEESTTQFARIFGAETNAEMIASVGVHSIEMSEETEAPEQARLEKIIDTMLDKLFEWDALAVRGKKEYEETEKRARIQNLVMYAVLASTTAAQAMVPEMGAMISSMALILHNRVSTQLQDTSERNHFVEYRVAYNALVHQLIGFVKGYGAFEGKSLPERTQMLTSYFRSLNQAVHKAVSSPAQVVESHQQAPDLSDFARLGQQIRNGGELFGRPAAEAEAEHDPAEVSETTDKAVVKSGAKGDGHPSGGHKGRDESSHAVTSPKNGQVTKDKILAEATKAWSAARQVINPFAQALPSSGDAAMDHQLQDMLLRDDTDIEAARALINTIENTEVKAGLRRALHWFIEYRNQRDNTDAREKKDGGTCAATSVTMALHGLGVIDDRDVSGVQEEDHLLAEMGHDQITAIQSWGKAARKLNANIHSDVVPGWNGYTKDDAKNTNFADHGKKADFFVKLAQRLADGETIVVSNDGHVMHVVAVTEDGLVLNDPYGRENQIKEGQDIRDKDRDWVKLNKGKNDWSKTNRANEGQHILVPWHQALRRYWKYFVFFKLDEE